MPRLSTLRPALATLDTRIAPVPEKRPDAELLTPEHRRFRQAVLARAGYRCEWVENGIRCSKRGPVDRLVADHIIERADGGALYDTANGQCLCVAHNTLKGVRARSERNAR